MLCSTTIKTSNEPEDRRQKFAQEAQGLREAASLVVSGDDDGNLRVGAVPAFRRILQENGFEGQDKRPTGRQIAILAVAAAARLTLLGMKPPHFDEGVNGWFVDQMTQTGFYHYDPTNYHGPFHFYVLFLFQTLFGRHVWALRLPLALVGWGDGVADDAVRPIHGAAGGAVGGGGDGGVAGMRLLRAVRDPRVLAGVFADAGWRGDWRGCGIRGEEISVGGLDRGDGAVLTKETYVIHFAACALAFPCLWLLGS